MDDILQHNNQIYIRASSTLADQKLRVLKQGEAFGIFDVFGDIKPIGSGVQGLYRNATRFLSQLELRVGDRYPILLSSSITNDDILFTADLANSDITQPDGSPLNHSSIHFARSKFLTDNACYEELDISNFLSLECTVPVSFSFKSDFHDMFEIRGMKRDKRGSAQPTDVSDNQVTFKYRGLDDRLRYCQLNFFPKALEITATECRFLIQLPPKGRSKINLVISFYDDDRQPIQMSFIDALTHVSSRYIRESGGSTLIASSSGRFKTWVNRSKADILLMTTKSEYGSYPYAGIPWFNTVFGRDGIITALQTLWVDPNVARGVLRFLAKHQATTDNAHEDAEPGKVLHELRQGEMVDTGEVPFKRYYGSADATPLFVVLAGRYFQETGDSEFIESLWPHVRSAIEWIDRFGDRDGDGFVEYSRRADKGLINQGWKDSNDSISNRKGELAEGPIALAEIQGYVFEAKLYASKIAKHLGEHNLAAKWNTDAHVLKEHFLKHFWVHSIDSFALALDGNKAPCDVVSSNAGHCLFSGIADKWQAEKLQKTLLSENMFSGWGIRTLSQSEVRYNPMSYHNGSIWPHDNAMIAEGFARYGLKDAVLKIAETMFDVAAQVDLFRLPELFCGFPRRPGQGPTLYPVACSPQAWAAGSVFLILKACLGMNIDAFSNQITFSHPVLPHAIEELSIDNLRVGPSSADLLFRRYGGEVSLYVKKRTGNIEVSILK